MRTAQPAGSAPFTGSAQRDAQATATHHVCSPFTCAGSMPPSTSSPPLGASGFLQPWKARRCIPQGMACPTTQQRPQPRVLQATASARPARCAHLFSQKLKTGWSSSPCSTMFVNGGVAWSTLIWGQPMPCRGRRSSRVAQKHAYAVLPACPRGMARTRMPSNLAATNVRPGSSTASANAWSFTCRAAGRGPWGQGGDAAGCWGVRSV